MVRFQGTVLTRLAALLLACVPTAGLAQSSSETEPLAGSAQRSEAAQTGIELTYAGRRFSEWARMVRFDLDPATRKQGYLALRIFGQLGSVQKQSLEAMLAGLNSESSEDVLNEGYLELRRLGDAGTAELVSALKHEKRTHRLAAARTLSTGYFNNVTEDIVAGLMEAATIDDAEIRKSSCAALGRVAQSTEFDFSQQPPIPLRARHESSDTTRRVLEVLNLALEDEDMNVRIVSADAIGRLGSKSRESLPNLIGYLEATDARIKLSMPREEEPDIQFDPPIQSRNEFLAFLGEQGVALRALQRLGTDAKPALPILEAMTSEDFRTQRLINETIRVVSGESSPGNLLPGGGFRRGRSR